jgi:hypothetical protein
VPGRILTTADQGVGPLLLLRRPQRDEAADDVAHGGIRREFDQQIVEFTGDASEGGTVGDHLGTGVEVAGERGHRRLQPVRAARDLGRTQRFEQLQPGGQVSQGHRGALQRQTEVIGRRELVGPVHLGATPRCRAAP